jgi:hypothetical protein
MTSPIKFDQTKQPSPLLAPTNKEKSQATIANAAKLIQFINNASPENSPMRSASNQPSNEQDNYMGRLPTIKNSNNMIS